MYMCPVCYYQRMQDAPQNYNICECCGTEFGNDDEIYSHEELRSQWIANGTPWFFRSAPVGWNPWLQLTGAYYGALPYAPAVTYYGGFVSTSVKTFDVKTFEVSNDVLAHAA